MSFYVHNITPVNAIATPLDQPQVGDHFWFILTDAIVHNPSHTHWLKMSNWSTRYQLLCQDLTADVNLPANAFIFVVFDGTQFQIVGTLPANLASVVGILALANGGTGADLSATGPGVVIQSTAGANLSLVNPTAPIELVGGALRLSAGFADRYLYSTATDTYTEGTITAFGRSLLDDADAAAGRTTLGITVYDSTTAFAAVLAADGSGSGLDADLLDGQHAAEFAAASHTHAAGDITSGSLSLARGGTGDDLSAAPEGLVIFSADGVTEMSVLAVPDDTDPDFSVYMAIPAKSYGSAYNPTSGPIEWIRSHDLFDLTPTTNGIAWASSDDKLKVSVDMSKMTTVTTVATTDYVVVGAGSGDPKKVTVANFLAQLDAAINLFAAGRLEYQSATQLRLNAWAGQYLDVGGEIQTVDGSTAGCQLAPSDNLINSSGADAGAAMAANTTYYVYRSNSTASFAASDLRASTTAPSDFRGDKYLATSGNGAKWRYVGMVRTNGSTQFTDNLLVVSWLNRRLRHVVSKDTTDYWTYETGSWRGANNGNSSWKVDFLANGVDVVRATAKTQIVSTSGHARFAIGLSSTSAPDADCLYESGGAANGHVDTFYLGVPAIGYQYLQALEYGTTGAYFYGDNGGVSVGGIFVEVMG